MGSAVSYEDQRAPLEAAIRYQDQGALHRDCHSRSGTGGFPIVAAANIRDPSVRPAIPKATQADSLKGLLFPMRANGFPVGAAMPYKDQ